MPHTEDTGMQTCLHLLELRASHICLAARVATTDVCACAVVSQGRQRSAFRQDAVDEEKHQRKHEERAEIFHAIQSGPLPSQGLKVYESVWVGVA